LIPEVDKTCIDPNTFIVGDDVAPASNTSGIEPIDREIDT
jgi:hypothetical protein